MKVFVTRPVPETGINMLRQKGYEVVINEAAADREATKEEVLTGIKGANALLCVLTEEIGAEIMDAGLPSLKVIANYAVGFDNIDLKAAKGRNIMVANTPSPEISESVAEHTFALMLSIARRIVEADQYARDGKYRVWGPKLFLGTDIVKRTLGVVGLGRIGATVAYHAVKGFKMKVLYNDVKPNPEFEAEYGAVFVEKLEELLPQCDFVSLHVPLLESTRHLINAERLKLMKSGAYLINTARGPVIDEKALAAALKNGTIRGAAIDVFEREPEIEPALKTLQNVIITPHIASATENTRNKMSELAAINIIEALEGGVPPNLVKNSP